MLRPALVATALVFAGGGLLQGCNGEGERVDRELRDEVRGVHNYLGARNIRIDTRLPER